MSDRQRLYLAGMAIVVLLAIIAALLLLGDGGDEKTSDSSTPEDVPEDVVQEPATATPLPTEIAVRATDTPVPTLGAEALATIASFPPTATPYILPTPAGPRRLDIPALNYSIPVPIVELPLINREWDVSNLGHSIGWLDQTTWLDPTWGNTVLVGHIQLSDTEPGPFRNLDRLVPGDEIHVLEGDRMTSFIVSEVFTVSPADMDVIAPTLDPTLTLITCTNWSDNRGVFADRLVIRAVPADAVATDNSGS